MSFVARKSLPALAWMLGLVVAAGVATVALLHFPIWLPTAIALGMMLVQYAAGPRLIRWLVPARVILREQDGYATDLPLGRTVAARCRQAGIPLVTLGLVDDGCPNAFTFGRSRRSAHVGAVALRQASAR